MNLQNIRDAVVAILGGISGVGQINDIIPAGTSPDFFREHFCEAATGKVNGWTVQVLTGQGGQRVGAIEHALTITVRGLLQVEDSERSRATAEGLLASLEAAFAQSAGNRLLPLAGTPTVDYTDPPTLTLGEAKVRGAGAEIVCHVLTCTFRAYVDEALAA